MALPDLSKLSIQQESEIDFSLDGIKKAVRLGKVFFDLKTTRGHIPIDQMRFKQICFQSTMGTARNQGSYNIAHIVPGSIDVENPFQNFYKLDGSDEYYDRLRANGYTFRWTQSFDNEKMTSWDDLCEELYLTLYASHMGVGPPVYAATIIKGGPNPDQSKLYMLLGGGQSSNSFLIKALKYNSVSLYLGELYVDACRRAAKAGLLLLDIKPGNAIFVDVQSDKEYGESYIDFIDYGNDFAFQLFDKNDHSVYVCIMFINMLLLAVNIRCSHPNAITVIKPFVTEMERLQTTADDSLLCMMMDVFLKHYFFGNNTEIGLDTTKLKHFHDLAKRYVIILRKFSRNLEHYAIKHTHDRGKCPHKWQTGPEAPPILDQLKDWLRN